MERWAFLLFSSVLKLPRREIWLIVAWRICGLVTVIEGFCANLASESVGWDRNGEVNLVAKVLAGAAIGAFASSLELCNRYLANIVSGEQLGESSS